MGGPHCCGALSRPPREGGMGAPGAWSPEGSAHQADEEEEEVLLQCGSTLTVTGAGGHEIIPRSVRKLHCAGEATRRAGDGMRGPEAAPAHGKPTKALEGWEAYGDKASSFLILA